MDANPGTQEVEITVQNDLESVNRNGNLFSSLIEKTMGS